MGIRILVALAASALLLSGCAKEDGVSEPEPEPQAERFVAIPLEVDFAEITSTSEVAGTVAIPANIGVIDSVFFRWEGIAEPGNLECVDFGGGIVPPTFAFSIRIAEMNAWWSASQSAEEAGITEGETPLRWYHFVPRDQQITEPPWELFAGREWSFTLLVEKPGYFGICGYTIEPRGEFTSASLVARIAE